MNQIRSAELNKLTQNGLEVTSRMMELQPPTTHRATNLHTQYQPRLPTAPSNLAFITTTDGQGIHSLSGQLFQHLPLSLSRTSPSHPTSICPPSASNHCPLSCSYLPSQRVEGTAGAALPSPPCAAQNSTALHCTAPHRIAMQWEWDAQWVI